MELLMTIIVIAFLLFIFWGFVAVILDQRSQVRHYEDMWVYEHRENEKLAERIVELNRQVRELQDKHLEIQQELRKQSVI